VNGSDETRLYAHPIMLAHEPGPGHPERRERLETLLASFAKHAVPGVGSEAGRAATREELEAIHAPAYLDRLARAAGRFTRLDPDTAMSPQSWEAGLWAAGSCAAAVEAVATRQAKNAFVWARPPGHHAEEAQAMGFCLLNNVAVAAAGARARGFSRILLLDWDVHHGNGTQHTFEARADVLFMSAHQYPFYPGTGAATELGWGPGLGFTVNCGLPPGQTDADYGAVFRDLFLPVADAYRPDFILVSAGFDSHARDPLGEMAVSERGFAAMCTELRRLAEKHCEGRLVLVLEGGYDLAGLEASCRACLEVLAGHNEEFPGGAHRAGPAIAASRAAATPRWKAAL